MDLLRAEVCIQPPPRLSFSAGWTQPPAPSNIQTSTYTIRALKHLTVVFDVLGLKHPPGNPGGDGRSSDCAAPITKPFETSSDRSLWTNPNTLELWMLLTSLIFYPSETDKPMPTCDIQTFPAPFTCTPVLLPSVLPVKNKSQTVSLNVGQGDVFLWHTTSGA